MSLCIPHEVRAAVRCCDWADCRSIIAGCDAAAEPHHTLIGQFRARARSCHGGRAMKAPTVRSDRPWYPHGRAEHLYAVAGHARPCSRGALICGDGREDAVHVRDTINFAQRACSARQTGVDEGAHGVTRLLDERILERCSVPPNKGDVRLDVRLHRDAEHDDLAASQEDYDFFSDY